MTEAEVIDWFMRWAAEYIKLGGPTWDREGKRLDANPRWRVYKLCVLLGDFRPEDLTRDALTALAATLKGKPAEDFPEWWPDADWAFEQLQHRPLAIAAWKSNWRDHRQDRGNGRLRRDAHREAMEKLGRIHDALTVTDPPYHKLGIPKGI